MKKRSEKKEGRRKAEWRTGQGLHGDSDDVSGHHRGPGYATAPRRAERRRKLSRGQEYACRTSRARERRPRAAQRPFRDQLDLLQRRPIRWRWRRRSPRSPRTFPLFRFKAGVVEGRVLSIAEIQQLAQLPSKEELIGKIMFLLQAPAQRIATAVAGVNRNLAVTLQEAVKAEKFAQ